MEALYHYTEFHNNDNFHNKKFKQNINLYQKQYLCDELTNTFIILDKYHYIYDLIAIIYVSSYNAIIT